MPEQFLGIPKNIVRRSASLGTGGDNVAEELVLIDLKTKSFVLQLASVMIMEDAPQENLCVSMVVRGPNPSNPPIPPTIEDRIDVPIVQSGGLDQNGLGRYVGLIHGPIPIRPGEQLVFRVQRKAGPGTLTFHAHAWGFSL
ncbi:MAG: hypothetical protein NW703_08470 [Nitrospiraceae bacterium]